MKKKNRILVPAFIVSLLLSVTGKADAVTWEYSPDNNSLAFGVTVIDGVAQIGSSESDTQPQGIFGAGFKWTGDIILDFDADLYTWDSYNENTGYGTGYWDAFVVTASTDDYYWNLPQSDPITASASTWVWGGTKYGDGILESYKTAPYSYDTISLTGLSPGTTVYVSIVLDTKTKPDSDDKYASWGSFHVNPVPEPSTILLLGSGLIGIAIAGRRKKK